MTTAKKITMTTCLFAMTALFMMGCNNSKDSQQTQQSPKIGTSENPITIIVKGIPSDYYLWTGVIQITGNEPFTQPAFYISDNDSYLISGSKEILQKMTNLQGQKITILAKKKSSPMGNAIEIFAFLETEKEE